MEGLHQLSSDDLNEVAGGAKAFDYYNDPLKCRKCGNDDFTCLGWKVKPSGDCSEGYEYECNKCGAHVMVYFH